MLTKFRKKRKERLGSPVITPLLIGFLTIAVTGFLVYSNWRVNDKRQDLLSRIDSLRKEIQTMEEKKKDLEEKIAQGSSEDFLETKARENFNLKKPGEEVVVVSLPAEESGRQEKNRSFLDIFSERLKSLKDFFNK